MATQNYFKAKNGLEAPSQSTIAVTDSNFPTVRPTLNLDFAGSESVDSRITFTRASAATYTGADGKIKYAVQNEPRIDYDPITGECKGLLIEEQRTNTLTNSILTTYNKLNTGGASTLPVVYPNAAIAPDGTYSAYKAYFNKSSTGTYSLIVSDMFTVSSNQYLSFWAKSATGTNQELHAYWHNSTVDKVICTVTNTWTRFFMPITYAASDTLKLGLAQSVNSTPVDSSVYIWGVQVEAGSFATSYIPISTTFTSRASSATYFDSTGTLRIAGTNQARYGYGYDSTSGKWVSQGLILEGAATNMALYSEQFDNANWGKGNLTVTPNAAVAPDGSFTADKWNEDSSNGSHQISGPSGFSNSTTYTLSVYAKAAERNFLILNIWSGVSSFWTYYNLSTGVVGTNPSGTGRMEYVGNGWYRCSLTVTTAATGSPNTAMWTAANDGVIMYQGVAGNGIYAWGAQLEVGTVATSYIPTLNASVTRAADVSSSAATTRSQDIAKMTGANFSSWYNIPEGTVFAEFNSIGGTTSRQIVDIGNGTNTSTCVWIRDASIAGEDFVYVTPTSIRTGSSTMSSGKVALGYSSTGITGSYNGLNYTNAVSNTPPQNMVTMRLFCEETRAGAENNGTLKKVAYYPRRLTDAQIQALTS